ncbi:hypothetical protein ACFXG4_50890 [Nocardia sp. NPDC059246]|uniref:hypothetical protein n=1 Tax=unclassified Nocardia TaxID=2637762 RepID=UPI00369F2D76
MADIMIATADQTDETPAWWDADLPAAGPEPAGENRRTERSTRETESGLSL